MLAKQLILKMCYTQLYYYNAIFVLVRLETLRARTCGDTGKR